MSRNVLVLGGAGFIGSHVAEEFALREYSVTVIDGLMESSGGAKRNLLPLLDKVAFIDRRIEVVQDLQRYLDQSDVIVDAMAWTAHHLAMENPKYDLELNLLSHVCLIEALKKGFRGGIIYLGSRGQYGQPSVPEVNEQTPMVPRDVQGINKVAAESYFRVFSSSKSLDIASLRLPNCYGERQPVRGEDIGLVGGFIREILSGKTSIVFGHGRRRNILYVKELAEIIVRLSEKGFAGFVPLNVGGTSVTIEELVSSLIEVMGKGKFEVRELPKEIQALDWGDAALKDDALRELLGGWAHFDLKLSLERTIDYFQEAFHDLAM